MQEELDLLFLATHDGYCLTRSWGEQFGGSWDYDVWRYDQHLRTFESEQSAREFIDEQLGQAYEYVGEVFAKGDSLNS